MLLAAGAVLAAAGEFKVAGMVAADAPAGATGAAGAAVEGAAAGVVALEAGCF